jgi:hypothetical protein
MSPRAHVVDPAGLAQWCMEHLGSPPAEEIFRSGYVSAVIGLVIGLRLADDREVVVKVRPDSPRIAACVEVQRRMFQAGYPCPEPLTGAAPFRRRRRNRGSLRPRRCHAPERGPSDTGLR